MWKRPLSLAFAGAGLAAIYLSQVRISLVIACGDAGDLRVGHVSRRSASRARASSRCSRAERWSARSSLALTLGGPSIQERVMTLFAADPISVYHNARGVQLDRHVSRVAVRVSVRRRPRPLGDGRGIFSAPTNLDSPPMWAEIQFTSWMIDGGILLIALYVGALAVTAMAQWNVAMLERLIRGSRRAAPSS